jgi:hypothetical protein
MPRTHVPHTIVHNRCGPDTRVHVILRLNNPALNNVTEHHLMTAPTPKHDGLSHVYALVLHVSGRCACSARVALRRARGCCARMRAAPVRVQRNTLPCLLMAVRPCVCAVRGVCHVQVQGADRWAGSGRRQAADRQVQPAAAAA